MINLTLTFRKEIYNRNYSRINSFLQIRTIRMRNFPSGCNALFPMTSIVCIQTNFFFLSISQNILEKFQSIFGRRNAIPTIVKFLPLASMKEEKIILCRKLII